MRLKKLKIDNIASIREAEIDFTDPLLTESPVFLISGPTGSGKSTILDAICLALYGTTPRLKIDGIKGIDSQVGESVIAMSDARQYVTRSAGSGSVELSFIGNDGVEYLTRWSAAKAYGKADKNFQNAKRSLEFSRKGEKTVLNKIADIKRAIEDAVGLNYEEFCRTTMLAQGEFTQFLKSSDDDKSAILEKITGVDVYTRIGKRLHEITLDRKRDMELAVEQCNGVEILSDEELAALRAKLAETTAKGAEQKALADKLTAKVNWLNTNTTLQSAREKAETELKAAEEAANSDAYLAKVQLEKQWTDSADARQAYATAKSETLIRERAEATLTDCAKSYSQLYAGVLFNSAYILDLQAQIEELKAYLRFQEPYEALYRDFKALETNLKGIATGRKAAEDYDKSRLADEQRLEKEVKPRRDKAATETKVALDKYEAEDALLKEMECALTAMELPAKYTRREELSAALTTLQQYIKDLGQAKNIDKEIADLQKRETELVPQVAAAEGAYLAATAIYEMQRESVQDWMTNLRGKLTVGDDCPLCRQKVACLPDNHKVATLVASLEKAATDAKAAYDELNEKLIKLRSDIDAKRTLRATLTLPEEDEDALSARTKLMIAESETLRDAITAAEKLEDDVKKQRTKTDKLRKELDKAKEQFTEANDKLTALNNEIQNKANLRAAKLEEVDKLIAQCAATIGDYPAGDWEANPPDFGEKLAKKVEEYNAKTESVRNLEAQHREKEIERENIADSDSAICELMPQWKERREVAPAMVPNLAKALSDLYAKVHTALEARARAGEKIAEASEIIEKYLAESQVPATVFYDTICPMVPEEVRRLKEDIRRVNEALTRAKAAAETTARQTAEHLEKRPADLADDDTAEQLTAARDAAETAHQELNREVGAITQQLKDDEALRLRLQALMDAAKAATETYERWHQLDDLLGDTSGKKFRRIAQSYVLANLITAANRYMATLTDRYTLTINPGEFVIYLIDAYDGNQQRPSATISGGESFLVSLALALALSDIGNKLSVNTLFIDEGFGTLSGEPLRAAVETLRLLHSTSGRHVGIISHIDELRENIDVQLQVLQDPRTSSSSVRLTRV